MPEPEMAQETAGRGVNDLYTTAQTIGQDLGALLCEAIDGLGRSNSGQIAQLETRVTSLARLAEEVSTLRAEFAALRAEAGSQSEDRQLFSARLASVEAAIRTQQESQPQLLEQLQQTVRMQQDSRDEKVEGLSLQLQAVAELVAQLRALLAQLQEGHQLLLKKLSAQAEALRDLHQAALSHATQRDELRTAVQKLEMLAGVPAEVKPLPEDI